MTTSTCPPPQGGSSAGRIAALVGASALASLFLAACGGDSDTPTPPPPPPAAVTQVPASAAVDSLALETFAFNLALTDDTEPLGLDNITTLPTSETEDPIATP
ncbi:MAG: hypothetical protein ABJD97_12755 [Betaproteobacteria bacterium]